MVAQYLLEDFIDLDRRIRTVFDQRLMIYGLTYARSRILSRLVLHPDQNQTELAIDLGLEQATVVRLLDRMEEGGLIMRLAHGADRRVKIIALTPHGIEQAMVADRMVKQLRAELLLAIGAEELEAVLVLINRISEKIAATNSHDLVSRI